MAFEYDFQPTLDAKIEKLDKTTLERLKKKVLEIIENDIESIDHYKNLNMG